MVQHFKHLLLEKQGASGGKEAEKVEDYDIMSIVNKITARLSPGTILLLQFLYDISSRLEWWWLGLKFVLKQLNHMQQLKASRSLWKHWSFYEGRGIIICLSFIVGKGKKRKLEMEDVCFVFKLRNSDDKDSCNNAINTCSLRSHAFMLKDAMGKL